MPEIPEEAKLTDEELKQRGYGNARSIPAARVLADAAAEKAYAAGVDYANTWKDIARIRLETIEILHERVLEERAKTAALVEALQEALDDTPEWVATVQAALAAYNQVHKDV